ncbi:MAG: hypothetical protein ACRDI1_04750, partial [Actinomycetota bacterium]
MKISRTSLILAACLTLVGLQGFADAEDSQRVEGFVTDPRGLAIPGAVVGSGSSVAVTDVNGRYSLIIPADATRVA